MFISAGSSAGNAMRLLSRADASILTFSITMSFEVTIPALATIVAGFSASAIMVNGASRLISLASSTITSAGRARVLSFTNSAFATRSLSVAPFSIASAIGFFGSGVGTGLS